MKLQIERKYVEAMVDEFPGLSALKDQLRFGNKSEVSFKQLTNAELSFLQVLYKKAGAEMQGHAAQLSTLQKAMNDDTVRFEEDDLEMLLPACARYLINNAIRGWLFQANVAGKPMAYLVTRLDFTPSGEEETGRVTLELKANAKGKVATSTVTIRARDIANKTVTEIFAAKGFLKETPELISTYDDAAGRYFEWCGLSGAQFSGKGTGFYAEDPTASHRNTDWARKDVVVLSTEGGTARLVCDESILSERALTVDAKGDILAKYLRKAAKSNRYDCKVENEVEASQTEIPKGLFRAYPVDTPTSRWYDFSLCKWISFNTTTSRFRALFQSSNSSFRTMRPASNTFRNCVGRTDLFARIAQRLVSLCELLPVPACCDAANATAKQG